MDHSAAQFPLKSIQQGLTIMIAATLTELAKSYSKTIALVVIAAMDYADIVEAIESKDVLESTRIIAFNSVEGRLQNALEKVLEEINTWKL